MTPLGSPTRIFVLIEGRSRPRKWITDSYVSDVVDLQGFKNVTECNFGARARKIAKIQLLERGYEGYFNEHTMDLIAFKRGEV